MYDAFLMNIKGEWNDLDGPIEKFSKFKLNTSVSFEVPCYKDIDITVEELEDQPVITDFGFTDDNVRYGDGSALTVDIGATA